MKATVEIERLLHWTYREELPKRKTSSAENLWRDFETNSVAGPVDNGGGAQRYDFGVPHDDALRIEAAVAALPALVIDWAESFEAIMGDLSGLLTVNDLHREQQDRGHITQSSWPSKSYSKSKSREQSINRPRDVIFVGSIDIGVLVASHAVQGTRPKWYGEPVTCHSTPSRNDPSREMVVGECRGKNLYSTGSSCPLSWRPSLITIAQARADYLAWWRGLTMLAESLVLADHAALPPAAERLPWFDPEPEAWLYGHPSPPKMPTLPMKPQRETAGPTRGQGEDVPRRHPGRRIGA